MDGTYILELHKDEKKGEAKATIVMDFCTEVVRVSPYLCFSLPYLGSVIYQNFFQTNYDIRHRSDGNVLREDREFSFRLHCEMQFYTLLLTGACSYLLSIPECA